MENLTANSSIELVEQTNFSLPCIGSKMSYSDGQFVCGTCSLKERNNITIITVGDNLSYDFEQIEVDTPILDVSKKMDKYLYTFYDVGKSYFGLAYTDFKENSNQLEDIVLFSDTLVAKKSQVGLLDMTTFKYTTLLGLENIKTLCKRDMCLVSSGSSIHLIDPLSPSKGVIFKGHELDVMCLDSNPVLNHYFISGGMDRCVCLWDVRVPEKPVIELHDHTHW